MRKYFVPRSQMWGCQLSFYKPLSITTPTNPHYNSLPVNSVSALHMILDIFSLKHRKVKAWSCIGWWVQHNGSEQDIKTTTSWTAHLFPLNIYGQITETLQHCFCWAGDLPSNAASSTVHKKHSNPFWKERFNDHMNAGIKPRSGYWPYHTGEA